MTLHEARPFSGSSTLAPMADLCSVRKSVVRIFHLRAAAGTVLLLVLAKAQIYHRRRIIILYRQNRMPRKKWEQYGLLPRCTTGDLGSDLIGWKGTGVSSGSRAAVDHGVT